MQILKENIRKEIITTATQLFTNKALKNIYKTDCFGVKKSVSNLYKYFNNKEHIFEEIIKVYYDNFLSDFSQFIAHVDKDRFDEESNRHLAEFIFTSIKDNYIKFVLLMDKSEGTKYANFKDQMISGLENHISKEIHQSLKDEYIIKIFVRNFFYGIVEVAKNYKNDDWALKNINLLVQYHMKGISIYINNFFTH